MADLHPTLLAGHPLAAAHLPAGLPPAGSPLSHLGLSINPLTYLGDAASAAVGDVWRSAMIALWSAGVWLLNLAFTIIDAFTTPDLSSSGPLAAILPTTLWLGATVAVLMMFVQLGVALIRRDGRSIGRILLGVVQFGAVWAAYLTVAAGLVAAASGLEKGILAATVHSAGFSTLNLTASWPRQVTDTTVATVLGVLSLLIVIPAAFFYILIMLVREAALIILVATAPISAAGLVNDTTKVWFWKTLRWFISCLLIAPVAALVLGIGERISAGVVAGSGGSTAAAAGSAVVGVMVVAIGATCPLVLFRLLAFVEPGTASGAALRQSWSDSGGMAGLMSSGAATAATGAGGAATATAGDGRSGGEAGAEGQTQSRLASLLGPVGGAIGAATSMAQRAVDVGTDVLGQSGVGASGYSMTPTDQRLGRTGMSSPGGGSAPAEGGDTPPSGPPAGGADPGGADPGGGGGAPLPPTPQPPTMPTPPTPAMPGSAGGPGAGSDPAGAVGGAGGAGAGGVESAAAVAL